MCRVGVVGLGLTLSGGHPGRRFGLTRVEIPCAFSHRHGTHPAAFFSHWNSREGEEPDPPYYFPLGQERRSLVASVND